MRRRLGVEGGCRKVLDNTPSFRALARRERSNVDRDSDRIELGRFGKPQCKRDEERLDRLTLRVDVPDDPVVDDAGSGMP